MTDLVALKAAARKAAFAVRKAAFANGQGQAAEILADYPHRGADDVAAVALRHDIDRLARMQKANGA